MDKGPRLTLVSRPRAETYAHFLRADRLDHRVCDLQHEARAVLDRPSILVRPRVGISLEKLIQEVTVGRVDLDSVEPRFQHRVFCSGGVQLHVFFDLFHGQRARGLVTFQWDGARSDMWVPALLLKYCWVCDAAERPKLEINVRFVFVYRIRDLR